MRHVCAWIVLGLLGCGLVWPIAASEARKLRVLTTFLPLYCFAANVAGDLAQVENLLPANLSPHDYQFSRSDVEKIVAADLILVSGLGLESWLDKALRASPGKRPKRIVEATTGLDSELITQAARTESEFHLSSRRERPARANPHVWLDPRLAVRLVTNILAALQSADPAHATGYAANARQCQAELEKLDAEIEQALAALQNRNVVTYHDAFAYFARRYRLNVVSVVEEVPHTNPSPKHLSAVGLAVRENHVRVIFAETPFPSRLARQIARDLDVAIAPLDPLESGPLTPSAYVDRMRGNLRTIQQHLK